MSTTMSGIEVRGPRLERFDEILTPEALGFVAGLHREFNATREQLLQARNERQKRFDAGELPDFLPQTQNIRDGDWKVAPVTNADLQRRWVELTGPTERNLVGNMDPREAARLASDIGAGVLVPMHWELFPHNRGFPRDLVAHAETHFPELSVLVMGRGARLILTM